MPRMRHTPAIVILILFLVTGGCVAVAWLLEATDPGRHWISGRIEAGLSAPGRKVSIVLGRDLFSFHPRISTLDMADDNGIWLSARDIAIDISPAALLRLRLDIDRLDIGEILFRRRPLANGGGPTWTHAPTMPSFPLAVSVRAFAVTRLNLAKPLLGQPVTLALYGQGNVARAHADLTAVLERRDGPTGHARLSFAYDPAATAHDHLALDLAVNDPSGMIVGLLAPDAGRLPFDLSIRGGGPASAWQGTLQAKAGAASQIFGTLRIDRDKTGSSVNFASRATLGPIVPARYRPIFGRDATLAVAFRLPDTGAPRLTHLMTRAAAGSLTFEGDPGDGTSDLSGALHCDVTLASLSGLLGQRLDGDATLDANIAGPATAPRLSARIVTRGLAIAASRIDKTETQISITGGALTQAHGYASGELSGISHPPVPLPPQLAKDVLWSAELSLGTAAPAIEIRRARIDDDVLHADLRGTIDGKGGRISARMAVDDLAGFAATALPALAGRADAMVDLALRPDGAIRAQTRTLASAIRLGIPALDAVIGHELTLTGTIDRAHDGTLTLSDATMIAAEARASGKAKFVDDGTHLTAEGIVTLPRLEPFSGVLGMPVSGSAVMTGTVTGSTAAPMLRVNVDTANLMVQGKPIDRLSVTAATSTAQTLDLGAHLAAFGQDETASARLSWHDRQEIDLADIAVAGTAAQGGGGFIYDRAQGRVRGAFRGGVADLGPWSTLLNAELSGQLKLEIKATPADGESLIGKIQVQDFGVNSVSRRIRMQDTRVDLAITGLAQQPQGHVAIAMSQGRIGSFKINEAKVDVRRATGKDIHVAVALAGAYREPVTLAATALASGLDPNAGLIVTAIDGQLGSLPLHLRRAVDMSRRDGGWALSNIDIALGTGRITGSGQIDHERVRLIVAARQIELGPLARLFGEDEISGSASADGSISGPWSGPGGEVRVSIPALRLAATSHPELPPLAAQMAMTLHHEVVTVNGRIEALGHEAISVAGYLPLRIAPRSSQVFTCSGQLHAVIAGAGQLEDIAAVLPLGEDQIGGKFKIDLRVGGTMERPQADGAITIVQGRYDNLASGVAIRNLDLDLIGNQAALELRRLEADDGDTGHVSGTGRILLNNGTGPAVDLAFNLKHFVVARLDAALVTLSGHAAMIGSASAPHISGQLGIDRADIQIPDKVPSQIPTVAVIRVNSLSAPKESARPIAPAIVIGLDVTLTAPGRIFISGQGLTSEWQGRISASGTSDAPSLTGRFTSLRGTYAVLGKTFTLQRGVISFTGGGGIDPSLDILAERVASDITARVAIAGTASTPGLTLTSTPALPQEEILSRVLFGTGARQISTLQALQLAQAAAAFTGNSPDVMSKVRSIAGLDQLTLDSDTVSRTPAPKTAFGNTTINGGKYIAPGVFVGVQKGLTPSATKGQLQVTVSPHISFEGAISAGSSSSSLGLAYRRDY